MADNLTQEQRRRTMQAVKGKNTSLEKSVASAFHEVGLRFRRNVASLPGKPDFVFVRARRAVIEEMGECQKAANTIRAQIAQTLASKQSTRR